MKAIYSIHNSSCSSSKVTTKSFSDEIAILLNPVQKNNESNYIKKDLNETISDSEDEDNAVKRNVTYCLKPPKANNFKETTEHGRWTDLEHQRFLEGMILYGNDWIMVHRHIGTRSSTQARSHAQKFFIKIRRFIIDKTDKSKVKELLLEIFRQQMKELFDLASFMSSVDRIANLIILYEEGILKKKHRDKSIRRPSILVKDWTGDDSSQIISNKVLLNNGKESSCSEINSFVPFEVINELKSSCKEKGKIFHITKSIKKQSSINNPFLEEKCTTTSTYKNNYDNSFITAEQSFQENSVSINSNSKSMYNSPGKNLNSQIQYVPEECKVLPIEKCDPFKLEFEEIFNQNNTMFESNYYNQDCFIPSFNFFN